jgi:hypothetical protein
MAEWRASIGRVRKAYRDHFGRAPNLVRPRLFSEKMQWRKLFDLDPRYAILSDKIAARDYIAATIGAHYLAPLLLVSDDPDTAPFEALDPPYVVKSAHGSGDLLRVMSPADINPVTRTLMRRWLAGCHGTRYDEPGYIHVPRRVLAERMILNRDGTPPLERRMFVFEGRVRLTQTIMVEKNALRIVAYHDRDWNRLPWRGDSEPHPGPFPRPQRYDELIALADRLGGEFDHVRTDFYDADDQVYAGEVTIYTWSGLMNFNSPDPDRILGSYWKLKSPVARASRAVLFGERKIAPGHHPSA